MRANPLPALHCLPREALELRYREQPRDQLTRDKPIRRRSQAELGAERPDLGQPSSLGQLEDPSAGKTLVRS
jgi:hypothetical protein